MVCSHCKQPGHNYVTCPKLTPEQIKKIKEKKLKEKQELIERRRLYQQRRRIQEENLRIERERLRQEELKKEKIKKQNTFVLNNPNSYELALYFNTEDKPNDIIHFSYIEANSSKNIIVFPTNTIFIYPTLDVLIPGSNNAIKNLPQSHPNQPLQAIQINEFIKQLEIQKNFLIENHRDNQNTNIIDYYSNNNEISNISNYYCDVSHIQVEKIIYVEKKTYKKEKSELEKWKEVGLKSNYLLQELIKLGGKKYENLEPIFDMVQDIEIPNHNDYDKEIAGIPSTLTNVT
tara:strand:- start:766 stop:1632 length:867 start_codon:yes stop_codon:yes gene_type:complete